LLKVLFDQDMPRPPARFLVKHQVFTSIEMGWDRLKTGDLFSAAEIQRFEVTVTADQNLPSQRNLKEQKVGSGRSPVGPLAKGPVAHS
jgi:hypothetical protein